MVGVSEDEVDSGRVTVVLGVAAEDRATETNKIIRVYYLEALAQYRIIRTLHVHYIC